MPVSAFASGQHRTHGKMIARWSSTRERLSVDERRLSMGEVAEMDGTGLHERDNWPLNPGRPVSMSPEPHKHFEHARSQSSSSNAMPDGDTLPQVEGMHPDEVEDSESAAEDESESEQMQTHSTVSPEHVIASELNQVKSQHEKDINSNKNAEEVTDEEEEDDETQHTHEQEMPTPRASVVKRTAMNGTAQANGTRALQGSSTLPLVNGSASQHAIDESPTIPDFTNGKVSPAQDQQSAIVSDVTSEMSRRSSSVSTQVENHAEQEGALESSEVSVADQDSSADLSRSSLEQSLPEVPPRSPRRPVSLTRRDELQEESRDTPTPLQHTPPMGYSEFQRTNGVVTPSSNHTRQSSTFKGTPPSSHSRNLSRRGSNGGTAFIPSNKDRVRYSWQSLQDDEPNRPRIHIIKLMSETATASAGFPGGEAFAFSISPSGRRIAAYNSARLFVLQTAALPVGISQDYALKRRPHAVEIVDDGSTLAVLADEHTVNIYDLTVHRLKRRRTIKLDYPTNCIALSRTGGLLAAAYEGGIEIFSLDINALPTDRRAVRCIKMDKMFFSDDGSTLLGTTTRINTSSTVVVSVPLFSSSEDGVPTHAELKEAWCSELLHPENIRNSSHATFMREDRHGCNDRLFAWNGLADTFGVLNTADIQYGNIDFPVVISPPLSTCGGLGAAIHSCPAIDEHGDTVAMIVNDRTIRLYIVPHKAEENENTVEAHSIDHELDEGYGCPFSEARWVYSHMSLPAPLNNRDQVQGRLIVTSPGGVVEQDLPEESVPEIEGGRIIMFDFDPQFAGQPGQTFSLTLGKSPPQLLEEEEVDPAKEVAIVRRRTVNQSKSGSLSQRPITLGKAATAFSGRQARAPSPSGSSNTPPPAFSNRRSVMSMGSVQGTEASRSLPDLLEQNETADIAAEEPFSNTAPRATSSLQRAASNLQRHRFQTLDERQRERVSVDSSGNFLPLPEYTEEPNAPLPGKYRAMAGLDAPKQYPAKPSVVTNFSNPSVLHNTVSEPVTAPPALTSSNGAWDSDQIFSPVVPEGTLRADQLFSPVVPNGPPRSDTFASENTMYSPISPAPARDPQWAAAIAQDAASTAPRGGRAQQATSQQASTQLPRSLQRAYSNAFGSGPPPALIGDWENVSPVIPSGARPFPPSSLQGHSTPPSVSGDDVISPVGASGQTMPSADRYSRIGLNPPGQTALHRASVISTGSGSPTGTMMSTDSHSRRMPPHMRAFRNQASLFPPAQARDHVPLPLHTQRKAGTVAHPIMAWHPPAPSSSSGAGPPGTAASARVQHARGHSRSSSVSKKTAFPSTEKAKNMGFFRRKPALREFGPNDSSVSVMTGKTSRSRFSRLTRGTAGTRSERDCVVM